MSKFTYTVGAIMYIIRHTGRSYVWWSDNKGGGDAGWGGGARRPKQFLTYQSRQPNEVIMLY
jgi:hypothetical protein